MNNITHKKEYSEQDIEKILKETSLEITPSAIFMESLLRSLPEKKIPSPYTPDMRSFFAIKKISFIMAAFVLVALGAITYVHHLSSNQILPSGPGNDAINNQILNINNQMNLLDNDSDTLDQSLH